MRLWKKITRLWRKSRRQITKSATTVSITNLDCIFIQSRNWLTSFKKRKKRLLKLQIKNSSAFAVRAIVFRRRFWKSWAREIMNTIARLCRLILRRRQELIIFSNRPKCRTKNVKNAKNFSANFRMVFNLWNRINGKSAKNRWSKFRLWLCRFSKPRFTPIMWFIFRLFQKRWRGAIGKPP